MGALLGTPADLSYEKAEIPTQKCIINKLIYVYQNPNILSFLVIFGHWYPSK